MTTEGKKILGFICLLLLTLCIIINFREAGEKNTDCIKIRIFIELLTGICSVVYISNTI